MESWEQVLNIIDKGGTVALLLGAGFAVAKGWLVPGWVYNLCVIRLKMLEDLANVRAERMEQKLDKYEDHLRGRSSSERP